MIEGAIEPIDVDITAMFDEVLSPQARSEALAQFARDVLAETEQQDAAALGFVPSHATKVDGTAGASEDRVKPDGEIEYAFALLPDLFAWIADMLAQFAPVRSGRYKASFQLYADGVAIDPGEFVPASEFVFLSTVDYAGKIEGEDGPPESRQAPNGVFEAVAALAAQKFEGQATIGFSYRRTFDGVSKYLSPAITITLGS